MKISIIGLGKLGLCTAMCFAHKGFRVIGVDNNTDLINKLSAGICPIEEPDLDALFNEAKNNAIFTTNYQQAITDTDITLIIVPTPSKPDGAFDNQYIEQVLKALSPYLKDKQAFHIIDIVSTVMPTSCEKSFKPLLEGLTGKKCGKDFGLVYNPEFIALGSVIRDFKNPDMVLIGASDEYSANRIKEIYERVVDNTPDYKIMSLVNAEITKLALNCYVTMKISFANELGKLCEHIKGADVNVVTDAIGSDSRIGKKNLKAGLGFGGPCFPRDNIAFQKLANDLGTHLYLAEATVRVNNEVVDRIIDKITKALKPPAIITVLGLAYKPGTHITEASQSMILIEQLLKHGYKVNAHDPKAIKYISPDNLKGLQTFDNLQLACKDADCVVIMLPLNEYKDLVKNTPTLKADCMIVDMW